MLLKSLAIIGGMGPSIGDSIQGLQVLKLLKDRHPGVEVGLFRDYGQDVGLNSDWFYRHSPVGAFLPIPQEARDLLQYARLLDFRDLQSYEGFYRLPTVDFFMRAVGMSPDEVDDDLKRPTWLADLPVSGKELFPVKKQDYVILNLASSSPARRMPHAFATRLVQQLKANHPELWIVFTGVTDSEMRAIDDDINNINATGTLVDTEKWMTAVKRARLLITPDSSPYHLAEGLGTKSLVFFTTVPPENRICYYKHANGVDLDPDRNYSDRMERASPEKLNDIQGLWSRLDDQAIRKAITEALNPMGF